MPKFKTSHLDIIAEELPPEWLSRFADAAEDAFSCVNRYLSVGSEGRIRLLVSQEQRIPSARAARSEIIIPAERLRVYQSRGGLLNRRGPAIVHEMVHVLAPSSDSSSKYLEEGLAVFLEQKFGAGIAYPNFGKDIHEEASKSMKELPSVTGLEKMRVAGLDESRRAAYLLEGSFVRFLIERYGLHSFLKIYGGLSYLEILEQSLEEVEQVWRAALRACLQTA